MWSMKLRLRPLEFTFIISIIFLLLGATPAAASTTTLSAPTLIALANKDRLSQGLGGLEEDPTLSAVAQTKADDMAKRGYFSHISPDGNEPWYFLKAAGYTYSHAGENLALNFNSSTATEDAWMQSPGHRANILKPVYTKAGVGIAYGLKDGKPAIFVVEFFATPFTSSKNTSVQLSQRKLATKSLLAMKTK